MSIGDWIAVACLIPAGALLFLLVVAEYDRRHQERWKRALKGRAEASRRDRACTPPRA